MDWSVFKRAAARTWTKTAWPVVKFICITVAGAGAFFSVLWLSTNVSKWWLLLIPFGTLASIFGVWLRWHMQDIVREDAELAVKVAERMNRG